MIVVEGPDGAGKTELVKSLHKLTGIAVADKAVSSSMEGIVDIPSYITRALSLRFHPMIYDRFALISGPIYGPLCGMRPPNEIFMDGPIFQDWLESFRSLRPRIIYCLPPFEVVKENVYNEGTENSAVWEVWEQAYWAYWVKAHTDAANRVSTMIYDYTKHEAHTAANWLAGQEMMERG